MTREVPKLYQGMVERAKTSRPVAVRMFCLECVGYVRADVAGCTATDCFLWPHRPYRGKQP